MYSNLNIVDELETFYNTKFNRLRTLFSQWIFEGFSIRASRIGEDSLENIMSAARENYSEDKTEFFYDRKSGVVISGVHYHNDIADALYNDLYPEFEDEFMPDYAFENLKAYGFMSRVGSRSFRYEFSLNFQEKMYFQDYIRGE